MEKGRVCTKEIIFSGQKARPGPRSVLVLDLVVKLLKMLYRQPDFQLGKSFAVGLRAKGPLPPLAAASPGHNLPALAYLHIHAFLSPSTARGHSAWAWAPPPSSSCPGPRPQSPISPPLHAHSHHTAPSLLWAPGGSPRSPEVRAGEKTAFLSSLVLFSLHKRASGRRLDTLTVLPGGVLCCVNPHGTLVL